MSNTIYAFCDGSHMIKKSHSGKTDVVKSGVAGFQYNWKGKPKGRIIHMPNVKSVAKVEREAVKQCLLSILNMLNHEKANESYKIYIHTDQKDLCDLIKTNIGNKSARVYSLIRELKKIIDNTHHEIEIVKVKSHEFKKEKRAHHFLHDEVDKAIKKINKNQFLDLIEKKKGAIKCK